jgi:CTD small phosphatase-like protein 2
MNFNLINKVCYDYWNFFFNCSIKGNFSYCFLSDKNIINYFNSLFLVSILITYDLSFKEKYFNFFYQIIQNILQIAYENFLMIIQILLSNNFENNEKNVFIDELKYIINNSNINSENSQKINLLNKIKTNSEIIFNEITDIISHLNQTNYFENILNKKILDIFNNINYYSETEINSIFLTFILKINKNGSILFSTFNNNIPNNIQIISPIILNNIPKKPLTLILDLDQTIMSFISDNFNEFEGTTRTRPFLYNFLNLMVNYYEIIIFTASTRNYADPILDVIEKRKGNYFSYRLYREHCRIISNNYVKDISIINRNINRIIIVDNMSQNFKLQKENGILISSFWGYDEKDTALLELGEILELIALEMIESGYKIDIRDEIKKYKNDIYNKVSMN